MEVTLKTLSSNAACVLLISDTFQEEVLFFINYQTDLGIKKAMDLFGFNGHQYFLSVDFYSKWPEIAKLEQPDSS